MKNLNRVRVVGGIIFGLVLLAGVEAQGQGNGGNRKPIGSTTLTFDYDQGGLSALRTYVTTLIAQIEQSKVKIAQLETALNAETSARQAADTILQNALNGMSSGGVTQSALNAAIASEAEARGTAIAAEALLRSTADQALQGQIDNEADERATFDRTLAPLIELAPLASYITIETADQNGLAGPHVVFTGVNVHIRSGHASRNSYTENGKGNLLLGYNEGSTVGTPAARAGSHNLVVGPGHNYNFGVGFVVGGEHKLAADGASISGGFSNTATGLFSSVSAGYANTAAGEYASVSGGLSNVAQGDFSSATGGGGNLASGMFATVSGGQNNLASGTAASVTAGVNNSATGDLSSVSGGSGNTASATASTVGGGFGLHNGAANTFVP